MYASCWIGNFIQMSTSWGRFYKHIRNSNIIVHVYRHSLISFWNQTRNKNICKLNKGTLLRIYFRNLTVQRCFLQYKSQCLKKVNVKYVINRLWHEIFHIVPGISLLPISAFQLPLRGWYAGVSGWYQGRYEKCHVNNLLLSHILFLHVQ
jgi:hypothetical protein